MTATPNITSLVIDTASASSNALVAAVTGKRVTVYGLWIQSAGTVTVTFEDDDGTNLTGPIDFQARERLEWFVRDNYVPYLQTQTGDGFNMLLGGAIQVSGVLWYSQDV